MRIETYQNNILFSYVSGTDKALKCEERDNIIIGRNSFKNTYNSNGKFNKNIITISQFIDLRI